MNPYAGIAGYDGDPLAALAGGDLDAPSRQFCGFTPTTVATVTAGTIAVPLKANMFLDRPLFGSAACVPLSRCTDMAIGTISMNVGTQGIPCEAWKHDAQNTMLNFPVVASPAIPPTVSVYNGSAGTIIYEGGFIGRVSVARPNGM
jgi:hypothetical protein